MRGAARRQARARELVWFAAMLPHLQKPVTLEDFVGTPVNDRDRARRFHAAWDKVDRALSAGRGQ